VHRQRGTDFWGLYRRQSEAARADLLASQWGQRATRTTLIQSVAEAYFVLRSLDAQMAVTENTIKARQESLKLTQALEEHGAGSLADVRQAEELLYAAQANLPDLRRQIAIQENTISVFLGRNPEISIAACQSGSNCIRSRSLIQATEFDTGALNKISIDVL
jgi:outer membrane protein, multidrug efflux system